MTTLHDDRRTPTGLTVGATKIRTENDQTVIPLEADTVQTTGKSKLDIYKEAKKTGTVEDALHKVNARPAPKGKLPSRGGGGDIY